MNKEDEMELWIKAFAEAHERLGLPPLRDATIMQYLGYWEHHIKEKEAHIALLQR